MAAVAGLVWRHGPQPLFTPPPRAALSSAVGGAPSWRGPRLLLAVAVTAGWILGRWSSGAGELYPVQPPLLPPPGHSTAAAAAARLSAPLVEAPFSVLSWRPRVLHFPAFVNATTAAALIELARPQLEHSSLGAQDAAGAQVPEVRSSSGAFLAPDAHPLLAELAERIAAVTHLSPAHGEDFNALHYRVGQRYRAHNDAFHAAAVAANPAFGNRLATFLLYLNDVEAGGETLFAREGLYGAGLAQEALPSCADPGAFKLKPRAGDAVLFYSLTPDLMIDARALHEACPVAAGEKWVLTRWMHDKPIAAWGREAGAG